MQSFCRITCLSPLHPLSSMSLYFLCLRSRSSLCICECLCHWFNVFCTFFFFSLLAFHTEPHFSIGHHAQLLSLAFLQNLSWSLRNFIELHPRSRFLKSLSCFFFFYCFWTSDKPTFCTYPCSQLGSEGGRAEGARRVKSNTESLFYVNAPTTRTQNTRGFFFFRILYRSSIYLT